MRLSSDDHEIYKKYINGQSINSLAKEYDRLWKTIKKAIERVKRTYLVKMEIKDI